MWRFFKGKSPVIEKFISHPEFRKRDDGEIENDIMLIRQDSGVNIKFFFVVSALIFCDHLKDQQLTPMQEPNQLAAWVERCCLSKL